MKDKYLPIGTIVMLKGGKKRLMIVGFCMETKVGDKTARFDYAGCLYPEGVVDSKQFPLFNHDQIDKVYNEAYIDEEETEFKKALKQAVAKSEGIQKV